MNIDEIILNALSEDVGSGDITTSAILRKVKNAEGIFLIKQEGIIAGLNIVQRIFELKDNKLNYTKFKQDGDKVSPCEVAAKISGSASSILTAERTALNFIQRMSGIATLANLYKEKIKHTKVKILDTRKTVPGLRILDKLAVKIGGCENHRIGLYDMFLIKDNHIQVAGSITNAVSLCKDYLSKNNINCKIEVEVSNLEQLEEAIGCEPNLIMLDNFSTDKIKKAVSMVDGRCKLEVSGGINLDTVLQIAETGVDFISVGALTHSVKAMDISLEVSLS
jgi:nicotinate-nucleotide pyrophosphorylase (carboxylating)